MLPVKPCGRASVAPGKRRVVTHSEALEILARRGVHEDEMEELIVGLVAVQAEFHE
jgi:hypothetical protein